MGTVVRRNGRNTIPRIKVLLKGLIWARYQPLDTDDVYIEDAMKFHSSLLHDCRIRHRI